MGALLADLAIPQSPYPPSGHKQTPYSVKEILLERGAQSSLDQEEADIRRDHRPSLHEDFKPAFEWTVRIPRKIGGGRHIPACLRPLLAAQGHQAYAVCPAALRCRWEWHRGDKKSSQKSNGFFGRRNSTEEGKHDQER